MDTLLQMQQEASKTTLSFVHALLLSVFFTSTTVLGLSLGKHYEKTLAHVEVPTIHNAVRTSRRMDE